MEGRFSHRRRSWINRRGRIFHDRSAWKNRPLCQGRFLTGAKISRDTSRTYSIHIAPGCTLRTDLTSLFYTVAAAQTHRLILNHIINVAYVCPGLCVMIEQVHVCCGSVGLCTDRYIYRGRRTLNRHWFGTFWHVKWGLAYYKILRHIIKSYLQWPKLTKPVFDLFNVISRLI